MSITASAACAKYKNIFVAFFLYNVNRLSVTMEKDLLLRILEIPIVLATLPPLRLTKSIAA